MWNFINPLFGSGHERDGCEPLEESSRIGSVTAFRLMDFRQGSSSVPFVR